MFGLRKRILGLDIGSRSVKAVLLSRKGGQVSLDSYFYVDLPEALSANGGSPEQVLAALAEASGLRGCLVASAIEDREVQVMNLSLPTMPENEIRLALCNEIETQLGLDPKELSVDFTSGTPAGGQLEIHAFFTKLAAVHAHLSLLEGAKLRPYSLENAMNAALAAARFNEYVSENETCILVDAGDAHTSVGLVCEGELVQLNTIRAGAGAINQALMDQFSCTFENSELRKLSFQISGEAAEGEGKVIEEGYYQIIVGINDTANYFRASRKTKNIERVVLCGGGLMKEGLAALIEQSLNIPVTVADPLRKIEIFGGKEGDRERLPRIGPMLHVAVGLALRGVA